MTVTVIDLRHYLNTSVSDAKTSLELRLTKDPVGTARFALELLEEIQGESDQTSRRKMLAAILRKAATRLANDNASVTAS